LHLPDERCSCGKRPAGKCFGVAAVLSATRTLARNGLLGDYSRAPVRHADLWLTDSAAGILISVAVEDLLLHQANRRMPAPPGPKEPEIRGENRTIVFQGEREINAIPEGQLVLQRQIERAEKSRAHVE